MTTLFRCCAGDLSPSSLSWVPTNCRSGTHGSAAASAGPCFYCLVRPDWMRVLQGHMWVPFKCGKRPEQYYPAKQSDEPGFARSFMLAINPSRSAAHNGPNSHIAPGAYPSWFAICTSLNTRETIVSCDPSLSQLSAFVCRPRIEVGQPFSRPRNVVDRRAISVRS